jgi:YidC/Oxa1 family membrane protein insertase
MAIFNDFIYQPLYNILIYLYNVIPGQDFGIAIVAFTVLLRFLLIPLYKKQIESQKKLQELQPKIKEIQQKYKNDKEKQTREMMGFYKKSKTNPFSGCLPLIIQLIFLIAIFRILINISDAGLQTNPADLYSFVKNPGQINHLFLGLVDLTRPSAVLAVMAAIAQYFQSKMLFKKTPKAPEGSKKELDFSGMMGKQMLYLGPLLTLFIGLKFAAGLALYWLVSTLFMIIQQIYNEKREDALKKQPS